MQSMLRFKQTVRLNASEALKSLYFAENSSLVDCVDDGANNIDSSLSSLSSTSSDTDHDSDHDQV